MSSEAPSTCFASTTWAFTCPCRFASLLSSHVLNQALVDHHGYRLLAIALLPLAEIVYGSDNGGQSVHKDDLEVNLKMAAVAENLHLATHKVGMSGSVVE